MGAAVISVHQPHEVGREVRRCMPGPWNMGGSLGWRRRIYESDDDPPPDFGVINFDAATVVDDWTSNGTDGTGEQTHSGTHELGAGADRIALVFVSCARFGTFGFNPEPFTATFNGSAMTLLTLRARSLIWHAVFFRAGLPAAGSRQFAVTATGMPPAGSPDFNNCYMIISCLTFSGVSQSEPTATSQIGSGSGSVDDPFVFTQTTTAPGALIVNGMSVDDDRNLFTEPGTMPHTRRTNRTAAPPNAPGSDSTLSNFMGHATASSGQHATPGAKTLPWRWTSGSIGYTWLGVELAPAA